MTTLQKKILAGVLVAIALGVAVWSGLAAFNEQGKTIGHLGSLSEKTSVPEKKASVESGADSKKPAAMSEKTGEASASGAPADPQGPKGP